MKLSAWVLQSLMVATCDVYILARGLRAQMLDQRNHVRALSIPGGGFPREAKGVSLVPALLMAESTRTSHASSLQVFY